MRVHVGAGYRVYFGRHGMVVVLLLCGGDTGSSAANLFSSAPAGPGYWGLAGSHRPCGRAEARPTPNAGLPGGRLGGWGGQEFVGGILSRSRALRRSTSA